MVQSSPVIPPLCCVSPSSLGRNELQASVVDSILRASVLGKICNQVVLCFQQTLFSLHRSVERTTTNVAKNITLCEAYPWHFCLKTKPQHEGHETQPCWFSSLASMTFNLAKLHTYNNQQHSSCSTVPCHLPTFPAKPQDATMHHNTPDQENGRVRVHQRQ